MDLSMYINKFSLEISKQEHSYLSCILFSNKHSEHYWPLPSTLVGISKERLEISKFEKN